MLLAMVEAMLLAVRGSCVSELEYRAHGQRLRIVRDPDGPQATAEPAEAESMEVPAAAPLQQRHRKIVCAGMSGTFYLASAPDQPPLVQAGQRVQAGQQLALIESMKMLHTVEAEHSGELSEVLSANGAAVEAGTPLFAIDTEDPADV